MRKAILLYNPLSGRRRDRRVADVEAALAVLKDAGVPATAAPTMAAGEAAGQVRQAIADGCDTVFACGGDGTIHDVLQGLAGTDAALGIIPLGTANSLAHDLELDLSPADAARAAIRAKPRRVAVGWIEYQDFSSQRACRYFIAVSGIGVDAHLFYKLNARAKRHLGMGAYLAKAVQLWLTHRMEYFATEFEQQGQPRAAEVSQVLAVRIRDFGGVLRELAPGASLDRNDVRLVLFHTRSRLAYLGYIVRGLLGSTHRVPGIELVHSTAVACRRIEQNNPPSRSQVFVEADGELLGTLPAKISMVPNALTLLMPENSG